MLSVLPGTTSGMAHQIHKNELNVVLVDNLWFSAFGSRKWLFSVLMIVLIIHVVLHF